MLQYYTMTLIKTDELRQLPPKALPVRYLDKVLSIGKDKRNFSKVAEDFLYWCQFGREKPIAKTTLATYTKTAILIAKHFGDVPLVDISLEHIVNLKKDFIDRGSSNGYMHKILMLIRLINRFAIEELDMNVLSPDRIKLPPKDRPDPKYLSDHELQRIFACIPTNTLHGVRQRAILTTMLDTGMRISEVLSLNKDTIDWGDKSAYIIGKGSKKRKVLFRDWSLWWIRQYLDLRRDDHEALFVIHQTGYPLVRLEPDDVRKPFRRIARKTGIDKFTPHIARKTAATVMWHNGADIQIVQGFLGHERITTTQVYVGQNYERIKQVQEVSMRYASEDTGTAAVMRWAKEHDQCLKCATKEIRHAGQGYCYNCYMNWKNATKRAQKAAENST